jgi:hypothetical protein
MNGPVFRRFAGFFFVLSLFCSFSLAADESESDSTPCMVETSVWMIANLLPAPPDFYQLCFGYQLDEKNTLFLNGITWKYWAPLAIPMWDPKFESADENYPGYVRAFGLGVGYQRFIWKGFLQPCMPFLSYKTFIRTPMNKFNPDSSYICRLNLGIRLTFSTVDFS